MHTKEFARSLRAFAELAEFERSQELYRLAACFDEGHKETILTRMKRMSPSTAYPLRLKESLEAIEQGFRALGATKQANALRTVLTLFAGRPGAAIGVFIAEISSSSRIANLSVKRFKTADIDLVKSVASQLAEPALEAEAFEGILATLSSSKAVGTPTLVLIANCYLGNQRIYRDRKSALEAIERHFRGRPLRPTRQCEVLE
ncbi:hypothetical protein [Hyphomicrobium sp.]|uniref:hypothetical protein n=1 Tax=Hyphomicrobium sp. TaxID=82 RepID=UPI001DD1D7EE|nr:hypothetical protein [Hyphomicrobium sp.]MBY0559754.1 hypothetical protein [Hyphomicrobium sp.]